MKLTKAITIEELQQTTLLADNAKTWTLDNLAYLNKPMKLFGKSMKTRKGDDIKETHILYLQPADKVAVKTLCPYAKTAGCEKDCLISSGQLGMTSGQMASTKRTILLLLRPNEFKTAMLQEIDAKERKALKTGIKALFRLNGTSDIDFSDIITARPNSQFYDYTKILARVVRNGLSNYDLTYSASMYSEHSRRQFKKAVFKGIRIATAWNTKDLADDAIKTSSTLEDFDKTDLRPLDGQVIGKLTRKGSNKAQRATDNKVSNSFFVTEANLAEFNNIIGA